MAKKEAKNMKSANTQAGEKKGSPLNGVIPPEDKQFGKPNGNKQGRGFWKKEDTPRYKLEQMMKMTDDQLREIAQDKKASRFEQVLATAVHKGDIKVAFEMIDQVYGKPLQRFEGEVEMPAPLVDLTKRRRKKK